MTGSRPSVYLAGPDVFLPKVSLQSDWLKAFCDASGLKGVFPLDGQLDLAGLSGPEAARRIRDANKALIDGCDAVLVNMTPFRGPGMDAGSAWEMGYADAKGLPIAGYTLTPGLLADLGVQVPDGYYEAVMDGVAEQCLRPYRDRVQAFCDPVRGTLRERDGQTWDPDGWLVEDFDLTDNLMMACGLVGDTVHTSPELAIIRLADELVLRAKKIAAPGP
jgi:nucleoside 2-deoxyribosyltransferase